MSAPGEVAATSARFSQWRDRVAARRVLVVGDVMLDRYWFGDVERISPEAPVPVVKIARTEERPGGAANVARNVAALGAHAMLLSATGEDEPARYAVAAAADRSHQHVVPARRRADDDGEAPRHRPPAAIAAHRLRDRAAQRASCVAISTRSTRCSPDADALVLSDYGKGGLAHIATMIERARAAGKPVLVDPKGDDWDRYRGATVITPNRSEFRQVGGPRARRSGSRAARAGAAAAARRRARCW